MAITAQLNDTLAIDGDLVDIQHDTNNASISVNEHNAQTYKVADATANDPIDMNQFSDVHFIKITTDQTITLRINGTDSVVIDATKMTTSSLMGVLVLSTSSITSLDISNSSGAIATVRISLIEAV